MHVKVDLQRCKTVSTWCSHPSFKITILHIPLPIHALLRMHKMWNTWSVLARLFLCLDLYFAVQLYNSTGTTIALAVFQDYEVFRITASGFRINRPCRLVISTISAYCNNEKIRRRNCSSGRASDRNHNWTPVRSQAKQPGEWRRAMTEWEHITSCTYGMHKEINGGEEVSEIRGSYGSWSGGWMRWNEKKRTIHPPFDVIKTMMELLPSLWCVESKTNLVHIILIVLFNEIIMPKNSLCPFTFSIPVHLLDSSSPFADAAQFNSTLPLQSAKGPARQCIYGFTNQIQCNGGKGK